LAIVDISGVSSDALNLKLVMDRALEKVEAVFQSYDVPLPERRYWTIGAPAIDCAQLVVSFVQAYLGTPGDEASTPQRCHQPRSVVLSISIAREIPTVGQSGRPPSGTTIEEASYISAVDAWVLMESINLFDQWEEGDFGMGVIATVEGTTPAGGFQVTTMQLTMVVP
jgi:hypothetical protein